MAICPMMLDRTFLDTSDAVGRFGKIRGYGSVRPTANSVDHQVSSLVCRQDKGASFSVRKRIKAMPRTRAPPQSVQIHLPHEQKENALVTAMGMIMNKSMYKNCSSTVNKGHAGMVGMK